MPAQVHHSKIAGTSWSPAQYLKFGGHRLRPALELLDRVPLSEPTVVFDLGCGPGEMTRLLAERWPAAAVYGLDNSPEMLDEAAAKPSRVQWVEADIEGWTPAEAPDLIYSNATLHWVPNHQELFPHLRGCLRPKGCLAVQMPLSWDLPSHRLMRATLADGGHYGSPLGSTELREAVGRRWVEDAGYYYDLLAGGASSLDIWETEYLQVLDGDNPVLEWVKSTGLRPILNGLDTAERDLFLATYMLRLHETYPMRPDGHTLYPFRRLFIVATT
jgi:trans-aconitate 2-methyltransferase